MPQNEISGTRSGTIELLVKLLQGGEEAIRAAHALGNLACNLVGNDEHRSAIIEAGALVLSEAAGALGNLACDNNENRSAIIEAGALVPLVKLLRGGPKSKEAAAWALFNLTGGNDEHKSAIIDADALVPLVEIMKENCGSAARALGNLASGNAACKRALLDVMQCNPNAMGFEDLRESLVSCASSLLTYAEAGDDVDTLEAAIARAATFSLPSADIERARTRLNDLKGEKERKAMREAYGLGKLSLPDEFVCPITYDKMKGVCSRDPTCPVDFLGRDADAGVHIVLATSHSPPQVATHAYAQIPWSRAMEFPTSVALSRMCCSRRTR